MLPLACSSSSSTSSSLGIVSTFHGPPPVILRGKRRRRRRLCALLLGQVVHTRLRWRLVGDRGALSRRRLVVGVTGETRSFAGSAAADGG